MLRSFVKQVFVAGAAVVVCSCGPEGTPSPEPVQASRTPILGDWTLRTVNGQTMPYTLSSTSTTSTVLTDEDWELTNAYALHQASSNDYAGTSVTAIHLQGRTEVPYAFDGSTVSLLLGSHAGEHLTVAGDSLTWTDAGLLKVFRRK